MNIPEANTVSDGLIAFEMNMDTFPDNRLRTIRVWLPKDYNGIRRFPVLYMHDGQNLFDDSEAFNNRWHVNQEMKRLYKENLSAIIVGVDNAATRMSELCPNMAVNPEVYTVCGLPEKEIIPTGHLYAQFITETLKPFIDETYATLPDRKHTAIGGSSMGGLMSLYMLSRYPQIYGKAMVFSPNFITHSRDTLRNWIEELDYTELKNSRIFLYHGGIGLEASNLPLVWEVVGQMRENGLDDTHLAFLYDSRQPHYETAWRKYFCEAFRYLFVEDNSEAKYYQ